MFPKTSRVTSESSCHCRTVAAIPETTVTSATTSPMATASWFGFTRRVLTPRKAIQPVARAENPSAVAGRRTGARHPSPAAWGSAVHLRIELAHPGRERREHLVVERGDLVEQARELAGAEHGHGQRRRRHHGGCAGAVVEQRQLAHAVAGAEGGDLLSAPEHVGHALHDDERLPADVALGDE